MSYAIIETGGKQVRAEKGGELEVERLDVDAGIGKNVTFDKVLLFADKDRVSVGQPYVKGASVEAEVMRHERSRKLISFKYIRRENDAKTKIGHRQWKTHLKVTGLKHGA